MMKEDQVNETIRRWRETPEEDLKPEDYQQFKNLGSACLTRGDNAQLLKFVQDEKNQGIVKSMGCVLTAPLVNEVVKKGMSLDPCQAAITHLTSTCRPDELLHSLLELIEDIDPAAISETIIALVPHLKTVLLRMEGRKAARVGLVLTALQKQLLRLPVPYTKQQEEADEYGLCRCCTALAEFTKSFVEEVKGKDGNSVTTAEDEELRTELLKFCMRSLREPLLEAELNRNRKSSLWLFATEIMVTLPAIQVSLSELLFFSSLKKSTVMDKSQSKESRACLAYLLFVQLITIDSFPAVFSPVFVLQCNMEYINELLSSKKESHLLKGLALYGKSLESVQDNSLPVSLLELKSFYSVPQKLRQVLTDCPMQHLRESGLQVFQLFINKLDAEAKHKFFRCMLKVSNHAGVESYIVKNIKNQVEFSMKPGNANKWFLGEDFLSLLRLVLSLPQGSETDLLNSMDRIMESLNLVRYLLIRDKEPWSNTDVWEELGRMKDEYLKMLRVCISISRPYYSAELNALREDQKLKAKEARDAARSTKLVKSLTVKHENVSDMSPEVQHQVLQSALVTFDLMESLIVRIEEITEEKLKIQ
ncbi:glomulin-like [Seriola lalandi dorsalis]|uniref:Glomulin, FKBP associated protein b n=1 Tax=Seriola lalandi dorsalis TaxID=1841481 RepID=A0A3B4Y989_SERLL|nr:glomulin-like [Seriola lalandi dorsalis]